MARGLRFVDFSLVAYWALYLTATMALFEVRHITPEAVGGVVGWILIVEVPRVLVGFWLSRVIFKRI